MIKAAIRSRGGNVVFGYLVAVFIGLLMTSIRWRRADRRALDDFMAANPGIIVVFWHERLFAMPYLWPSRRPLCALQSTHADGRMMAACIRRFGVGTIWGSSSRSALSGLRGMMRALDEGRSVQGLAIFSLQYGQVNRGPYPHLWRTGDRSARCDVCVTGY